MQNNNGVSALVAASTVGLIDTVDLLIEYNAHPN